MAFTLNQLEVFVCVVNSGSFSAAARKIGKAQSVISTTINNFELETGMLLFDRHGKYPVLTEAGKAIYDSAESILLHRQALQEHCNALSSGAESQVSLMVDDAVPYSILNNALTAFSLRYPQVSINVQTPEMESPVALIANHTAMLGLSVALHHYGQDIAFCRLGDLVLANVAPRGHPLTQKTHLSFSELHLYRQLVYTPHGRQLPTNEYLKSPFSWYISNYHILLRLLKEGHGWAIVPKHMIQQELEQGGLVELVLDAYPITEWQVGVDVIWSRQTHLGLAGRWLRDYFRHTCLPDLVNTTRSLQ